MNRQNYMNLYSYLRSRRFQLECQIDRINRTKNFESHADYLRMLQDAEAELTDVISVQSLLDNQSQSVHSTGQ
jgi:hypothetical protein